MTRKFIYTTPFRKSWSAMGLNDDNLLDLEAILLENPQVGDVIEGTGGARKMRIQLEGRGKRGGGRVIYLDLSMKIYICSSHILRMCRMTLPQTRKRQSAR